MIGQRLLHYEIIEVLGQGGMGTVYQARDTRLNRLVALKVFARDRILDVDKRQRFIQEAQVASSLNHPHIVTIYDIGQVDGDWFIAMEYVPGQPLSKAIPYKGMPLDDVLRYAIQIADALACAHAAGIIHRDLKPGNVMVTASGATKLVDFGLAKLFAGPSWSDSDTAAIDLHTREGTVIGTAAYMSPEQAEGRDVDARTDVFSFGAVLYEMATGQRAFRGESAISTLASVLREDPQPMTAPVPRDLEKIVTRCLRKDPSKRFQSMADVRVVLEDLHEELRPRRRRPARGAAPADVGRGGRARGDHRGRGWMVPRAPPGGAGAAGQGHAACHLSGREGLPGDFARRQRRRLLLAQARHQQLRSVRASSGRRPAGAENDEPGRRLLRRRCHRTGRRSSSFAAPRSPPTASLPSRRSAVPSSASLHGAAPSSAPRGRQTAGT